jgi:hypothetical protein
MFLSSVLFCKTKVVVVVSDGDGVEDGIMSAVEVEVRVWEQTTHVDFMVGSSDTTRAIPITIETMFIVPFLLDVNISLKAFFRSIATHTWNKRVYKHFV